MVEEVTRMRTSKTVLALFVVGLALLVAGPLVGAAVNDTGGDVTTSYRLDDEAAIIVGSWALGIGALVVGATLGSSRRRRTDSESDEQGTPETGTRHDGATRLDDRSTPDPEHHDDARRAA
jgi:hypothetical protein